MKGLFDTNILIDYLNGIESAKAELLKFPSKYISIITWIEVLVGFHDDEDIIIVKHFLNQFHLVNIDEAIANLAIKIRKQHKLRLPDALIWASAEKNDCLLITRNTKDFPESMPFIRVPYKI